MTKYALFLIATIAMADTAPISEENLRMAALRAIFPGMQILQVPAERIDPRPKKAGPYDLDSPDALKTEPLYRLRGKVTNEAERCASENLEVSGSVSDTRLLRFQLFRWPRSTAVLAILQYKFEGANPAGSCWSIGLLALLDGADGSWKVKDRYLLDIQHHSSLQAIRMVDLTGDGVDELVVESDFGGAETWGTTFLVFSLNRNKFEKIFSVCSRLSYSTDDMYKQALDVPRTLQQNGARFCFTKTTMMEAMEPFRPPRVTKPCYRADEGEDHTEAEDRNKLLIPLPKP